MSVRELTISFERKLAGIVMTNKFSDVQSIVYKRPSVRFQVLPLISLSQLLTHHAAAGMSWASVPEVESLPLRKMLWKAKEK